MNKKALLQAKKIGFSLIELMVVVAIIAFLSMIAMPSFMRFLAKTKRAEAYMNLSNLYTAQMMYKQEHNTFGTMLNGPEGIGWRPSINALYTYGFSGGSEGQHFFTGTSKIPASALKDAHANKDSFMIIAAGDIDGDGIPDILGVKETGEIIILNDDLA